MGKIEPMTGRQAQAGTGPAVRRASGAALLAAALLVFVATGAQAQYYDYGRSSGSVTVDQSVLDALGPEPNVPQLLTPNNPWLSPAPAPQQIQAPAPAAKGAVNLKRPSGKAPRKAVAAKKKKAPAETASVPTITATQPMAEPVPPTPAEAKTETAMPPAPVEAPAKPAPKAAAATKASKDAVKANPPPPEVKAAATGAPEPAPMPALPSSSASAPSGAAPAPAAPAASGAPSTPAPATAAPAPPALPAVPAPSKQASATPAPTPVTPPAAPTAATPPAPPAPAQTASRTPSVPLGDGTRIAFTGEDTELNDAAKQALAGVVQKLQAQPNTRVQLLAYASGTPDQASKARRTSLSRALSVRTYLLAQGVQSTRIDVRALGNTTDEQPVDRVDAIYAK
ncbi:MAG: OmpA family protein [Alphaproteobacteria bacterium]